MRHLLYLLLISSANNLDNVGVRIAYSIRGIKITTPINLWISVLTFVITSLAAFSGTRLSGLLTQKASAMIAMAILVGIGSWMIVQPYLARQRKIPTDRDLADEPGGLGVLLDPEKADRDHSKNIEFKEATLLGVGLSINNIGGGISAGMIGLNILWVGFLSATLSFLALWGGNYIADFSCLESLSSHRCIDSVTAG